MNRNELGLIGQIQRDGSVEMGDAPAFNSNWIYLNDGIDPDGIVVKNAQEFIDFFEVGFGAYVRYPDPEGTNNGFGAHYKNPWNGCISRDQITGILAMIIKSGNWMAMLRVIANFAMRGFLFSYNNILNGRNPKEMKYSFIKFFYNPDRENYYKMPDLTAFKTWAMFLRGFGRISWVFWPILCILDLQLIGDTHLENEGVDSGDPINYTLRMFVARDYIPTPTGKIAVDMLDKKNLLSNLNKYWGYWRQSPEFIPLYEKKLKELK